MNEIYANILQGEDYQTLLKQVKSEYLQAMAEIGTPETVGTIMPRIKSTKVYHVKCAECQKRFICNISTRKLCGACRVYHRYKKH